MSKYNHKTISFIIPTIGRDTLKNTLASINPWDGDEIIVIWHDPKKHVGIYGNAERQEGVDKAAGDYLAFIDDDDVYTAGMREIMNDAIREASGTSPVLFRIQYPNGRILPRKRWVKNGNVSTQMILVPNKKNMLAKWDVRHRWADFNFINEWLWPAKSIIWRGEIMVLVGHDDEKHDESIPYNEWKKLAGKA